MTLPVFTADRVLTVGQMNQLEGAVEDAQATAGTALSTAQAAQTAALSAQTESVSKAGDNMTGPLGLPGDPVTDLQAAPRQFVLNAPITATGSTVSRTLPARFAEEANVLDFGAVDVAGVADSSDAIIAAAATHRPIIQLPAGVIRVSKRITVGGLHFPQMLAGAAGGTTLIIGPDFDPTETQGVIVFSGTNQTDTRPGVRDLVMKFEQPKDVITTTAASSAVGDTTITVTSTAGILVGMQVYDFTNPAAIPTRARNVAPTDSRVVSIVGNVITLSSAILVTVASGHEVHFSSPREWFKTIADGGTATQGGTGIRYPWAISLTGAVQTPYIDNVMITGAWDGVYIRGSSFEIGTLNVMAFNTGLDVDECYNFAFINDYRFWTYGWGPSDDYKQDRAGLISGVYYDGTTVSCTFGEVDGLTANNISSWCADVNITGDWTWGGIKTLQMDGDYSSLNVTPTAGSWLYIGDVYFSKSAVADGDCLTMSPTLSTFRTEIGRLRMASASGTKRGITQTNGALQVNGGSIWHGIQNSSGMIAVSGGSLCLGNVDLDASGPRTDRYIVVTGSATVKLDGSAFTKTAGAGGVGVAIGVDSPLNYLNVHTWNGWGLSLPPAALGAAPSGNYGDVVRPVQDGTSIQVGDFSLLGVPTASHQMTAVGRKALTSVTTAVNNTAVGFGAGEAVTTGNSGTFVGVNAGLATTTAANNTAVGSGALQGNVTGATSTAIGATALVASTGSDNTALGYGAGLSLTGGTNNTLLGSRVGLSGMGNGTGNILIGVNGTVTSPVADQSHYFGLGGTGGVTFQGVNMNTTTPSWNMKGSFVLTGGHGFWGHAAPSAQPAAPVTLADVIAIIRGCGLSA